MSKADTLDFIIYGVFGALIYWYVIKNYFRPWLVLYRQRKAERKSIWPVLFNPKHLHRCVIFFACLAPPILFMNFSSPGGKEWGLTAAWAFWLAKEFMPALNQRETL